MKTFSKIIASLILFAVITTMLPIIGSASGTIAWGAANVSGDNVRIRSGPGLTHDTIANVSLNEIVVIIRRTNSDWHEINYNGTTGYMSTQFLDRRREAANFSKKGSISGNSVNMREKPNTNSSVLSSHNTGVEMNIIGINNGWYKVTHNNQTGYIRSDLMTIISQSSSSNPGGSSSGSSTSTAPPANRTLGQKIADTGKSFVGHRYVYGGSSPDGFDCSGFTSYVMRQHGIRISRTASAQYRDNGVSVNRSDLVAGDLVFFSSNGGRSITHVGLYIGDNKFVHASSSRTGVIISNLDSRGWYGAKRVT